MTDAKVDELLPCPFCGTSAILLNRSNKIFWVQCQWVEGCLATQINKETPEEAIKSWNERPSLSNKCKRVNKPDGGYFGTHCHICHDSVDDCKCGKLADDYVGKCPECEKFGHIKMRCDSCKCGKPVESEYESLTRIIRRHCTYDATHEYILGRGIDSLAEELLSKFGQSPATVVPTKEDIWCELSFECGNKERGDLLNSVEKEKELWRYAKCIHDFLTEGRNK